MPRFVFGADSGSWLARCCRQGPALDANYESVNGKSSAGARLIVWLRIREVPKPELLPHAAHA